MARKRVEGQKPPPLTRKRVELKVRPARADDLVALARLWQEMDELHARVAPAFFEVMGSDETVLDRAALRELLVDGNGALLVVTARGRDLDVIGCASLQLYDTPVEPGMAQRRRAYVTRVAVERAHRRSGVGRRLMQACREWAFARGAAQLVLTVWKGNRGAEAFYRALGYRPLSQVLGIDLP